VFRFRLLVFLRATNFFFQRGFLVSAVLKVFFLCLLSMLFFRGQVFTDWCHSAEFGGCSVCSVESSRRGGQAGRVAQSPILPKFSGCLFRCFHSDVFSSKLKFPCTGFAQAGTLISAWLFCFPTGRFLNRCGVTSILRTFLTRRPCVTLGRFILLWLE